MKEEIIKKRESEHDTLMRVIFGDEATGEVGMKKKVDEIHTLLTQAKNVGGFFNGLGNSLKWILVIAAVISIIKGWWLGIIASIINLK